MSERSRHGGVDRIPLPLDQGALWLCGKHFVGPDAEAAMQQVGATTVVCLNQRAELEVRYPDYVAWLQHQTPQRAVWFPIPDLGAPPIDAAAGLIVDLHSRIARGDTLLVHCGAGIGRAGTMAAALLMAMGFERERAVAHVGAHRPMAGPEAGAQRELLEALARTLPQTLPKS
ncbi:MAG: tyrosine-protein phosphatase [Actinobacteria bacterium]|nr:tyrosine-protein phosphatase [Actinomycetota bacterium]